MAYTEFYCRSGGSNLNGGSKANGAEPGTTAAYTSTNGNWNGSSSFTPTDGSTPANTVTVGDFASIYLDGATVGVFIARVTAVAAGVNGAITLSTSIKAGSAPTSGVTGRSIKVGGAWLGPNGASAFPFTLTNVGATTAVDNTHRTRINLKNDQTYTMTAGVSSANGSSCTVQGYSSTAGDLGKATIDFGTTTGDLWALSSSQQQVDLIVTSSATSGTGSCFVNSGAGSDFLRCVATGARNAGFKHTGGLGWFCECEVYACNKANTASIGGFTVTSGTALSYVFVRCISHDNTGSNADGFFSSGQSALFCCIADTNGGSGFNMQPGSAGISTIQNCDAYNNTGDGIKWAATTTVFIQNSNLIKNGGWGINVSGVCTGGTIDNCGYGSGTQANGSGTSTIAGSLTETGAITYGSGLTPWVDPANGDFRINLAAALYTGRGGYTQTAASYAGTTGYPDVGAAQHKAQFSYVFG